MPSNAFELCGLKIGHLAATPFPPTPSSLKRSKAAEAGGAASLHCGSNSGNIYYWSIITLIITNT